MILVTGQKPEGLVNIRDSKQWIVSWPDLQLHGVTLLKLIFVCGLVVRVYGYRYRGPGFDSRRYQIF